MAMDKIQSHLRHDLDDAALGKYIEDTKLIPEVTLPVLSTKIGYGQSNPTYFVDDANGKRFILRKKPSGVIISPVAHQIDREFRVLKALASVKGFPVPEAYILCTDPSIIGTPFYIMQFIEGRILTDTILSELSPADRRKVWFSSIETLGWLHSIDPDAVGLEDFGKKTSFYKRHCNTFSRIEAQQAVVKDLRTGKQLGRAHEEYDEIARFIGSNLPGERYAIVHGDFKFDNLVLHPSEPRVIAILDWELSTIGHPLIDVVLHTIPFWTAEPESSFSPQSRAESGMPGLDELLDRYSQIVGFDPRKENRGRDWEVAKIFNHFRNGTIMHGIQARTYRGQASSEFSYKFYEATRKTLDSAIQMVRMLKNDVLRPKI